MRKSIKHLFKTAAMYIFGVPVGACAFIAAYYFLFGNNAHNGEYISGMVFTIIGIMSLAVCMSFYSCYGNIALSMGATRKDFFAASQIVKVAVCLAMFIAMMLANATLSFFYSVNIYDNLEPIIINLGLSFILGAVGEAIGIICTRWGRIGIMVYIGGCVLWGVGFGVTLVLSAKTKLFADVVAFLAQSQWIILVAMIIVSVIFAFINRLIYKKSIVI